jgi:tRNA pseudouridine38-40 synthase
LSFLYSPFTNHFSHLMFHVSRLTSHTLRLWSFHFLLFTFECMPRFFIEITYKGTHYSGFQVQENANTIQAELGKVLAILLKQEVELTGSSRTDAGVHALQNFFHFDITHLPSSGLLNRPESLVYKLNAILPADISVRRIIPVAETAHARFDAKSRTYKYYISRSKNPFLTEYAYYFPYRLNVEKMQEAAQVLMSVHDFTSFSKRNTQAKTFLCDLYESKWEWKKNTLMYHVKANRFLRGMVRALTGTMLNIGRGKTDMDDFRQIIESKDCRKANFAVPAHGLFLVAVEYSKEILN